ncbi:23S rRNA (guanosine(2251)-2'-O)-methyltransferase RlmB [Thermoanaerobacterium sp. RBIITD]|uniref:23S rRNA (guanosine(2251)-2'-O)-methyltransferase RlmB n=1 Tax=Thermoanaerobacterium sp. RBIITD TaxID=1550240 RepID=UPI000BB82530|nr:23S rRNA (guanosine(2251)-2'-O)-methyltransferase RlmB [Thermoanaerobacterium sp. RBIITD]SNX54351.1 23S rRNA (guanosine2251-2'-O)-methyltransferase [Thermoanaerobacterium sp. RBIITD]
MNENIIYGRNPVMEAITSGHEIEKLYVSKTAKGNISKIIKAARDKNIIVSTTDNATLDKLSGYNNHQGVLASCSVYKYFELEDILNYAEEKNEKPLILLLDGITDTHNLGAIIRSAEAFSVHGIVIPKRRAVGVNSTVVKTSAGATEYIKVAKVSNINNAINVLKKQGVWIVGSSVNAKTDFRDVDYTLPIAIVIGSEGEGMSKLVKKNCDYITKIPMLGHMNSLNASVAASLFIYEAIRQRNSKA